MLEAVTALPSRSPFWHSLMRETARQLTRRSSLPLPVTKSFVSMCPFFSDSFSKQHLLPFAAIIDPRYQLLNQSSVFARGAIGCHPHDRLRDRTGSMITGRGSVVKTPLLPNESRSPALRRRLEAVTACMEITSRGSL